MLLDDIAKGLADIDAGRTEDAREVLLELRRIEKTRAPRRMVGRPTKSKVASR